MNGAMVGCLESEGLSWLSQSLNPCRCIGLPYLGTPTVYWEELNKPPSYSAGKFLVLA